MTLHRGPLRRRSVRVAGLSVVALMALLGGLSVALQPEPAVPDGPVQTTGALAATTPPAAGAATSPGESAAPAASADPGRVPAAATVDDVPRAWQRIAAQAKRWSSPVAPPAIGRTQTLPTVPASRLRDTLGVNVDVWRTEGGYRDFAPLLAKVTELRLRHARVGMQASGEHGLARMQQLGQIGVRLNVVMGDALGRYNTTPFSTLDRRLHRTLLPFVDSVEGSNEPDLSEQVDWSERTKGHQGSVVEAVARERRAPIAVIAPSVGRIANVPKLGSYAGLADAANAHAYSSAGEPSAPLDEWLGALGMQLPGGPVVVTEAGFQTDVGQTKYHSPLPAELAAAYTPRIILEAMRRGMPRVYLYELADRWADPFGVDTSAHFGLLDVDLKPKPAWTALVRLQRALLDGGAPDRAVAALQARVVRGPRDLRLLAFRRADGTAALALWRAVSQWDNQTLVATQPPDQPVELQLPGGAAGSGGLLITDVVSGERRRVTRASELSLRLGGSPVVVTGLG